MRTFYATIHAVLIEGGFVIAKRNDVWLLLDNENEESGNVLLSSRRLGDLLHNAEKDMGL